MTATRASSARRATEAARASVTGRAGSERRHDEADLPPQGRQVRPRVPLAGRHLVSRAYPPARSDSERAAVLGGSRAPRRPRWRLASSRRVRAPAGRAGLPQHNGRGAGGGESVTTAPPRRRGTPEPSSEPPKSSSRRTPKGPITHELDDTRSWGIPYCGVLLYDPKTEREGRGAGGPAGSASGSDRPPPRAAVERGSSV